jgi:hypothetical protein
MNYNQRLDRIEGQVGTGAKLSLGRVSKAFVMWTEECSGLRGSEVSLGPADYVPYQPPGEPLFRMPFTREDWEWFDSIRDILPQELEIRQRMASR